MGKKSRELAQKLTGFAFVGDVVLVFIMLWLAFEIRFHTSIGKTGIDALPTLLDYSAYIILAAGFYIGLLVHSDIYNSRNLFRFGLITARIVSSSLVWVVFVLSGTFLLRFEPRVSRAFFITSWCLIPAGLIGWRSIFHSIVTSSSLMAASRQRIAFVGWSDQTALLAANLRSDPEAAYQVVGYFEVDAARQKTIVPCLGDIEDFEHFLSSVPIDVVLLAAFDFDSAQISRIAGICEREMAELKLVPDYLQNLHFQNLVPGLDLESIGGIPMVGGGRLPLDRVNNRLVKRAMDILGAAIGFVISVPWIFFFGGLIYLASPGPIFYRQRRFGRNGKPFNIVKIRTEPLEAARDAESRRPGNQEGLRIGNFMRKWNIDDLPRFWNVLAGDMSLVGPRPERPDLIAIFKHEIARYNARHFVKPGITGWAQVNGLRENKQGRGELIGHDLWYVQNWSCILDIRILFMTSFGLKNAE